MLCALSVVFSVSCFSFFDGVAIFALPLSLLFSILLSFFSLKKLFLEKNLAFIAVFRELLQYEPYVLLISFVLKRAGDKGTSGALDLFQVLLWVLSSILCIVILHFLNVKHLSRVSVEWKQAEIDRKAAFSKKKKGLFFVVFETLSWIDALVQAVFMVLLLNVFIVQLYEIPSESMVPEFLVKDRVAVFKIFNGPKFPLSKIGFPHVKSYKRGDIVVFRNPHYSDDRKSEVRTFVSQLIYMCTLTMKNINVDEYGRAKADPLVKRVVGLPGEQLMMQDGILYSRTQNSDWAEVSADSSWACWDLNEVKSSVKKGILEFNVSEEQIASMLECEEKRRLLDISSARLECEGISSEFSRLRALLAVPENTEGISFSPRERYVYTLFSQNESLTRNLLSSANGESVFRAFMTDWRERDFNGDLYSEANFRLNLMIKLTVGRIVVRNCELLLEKRSATSQASDPKKQKLLSDAQMLLSYVFLLDRRNMPIFPKNNSDDSPAFIQDGCYFMMGDNRFNSLDMRHSYEEHLAELDETDPFSATYPSNIEPQTVPKEKILGTTAYRFWPVSRRGVPGHTGK